MIFKLQTPNIRSAIRAGTLILAIILLYSSCKERKADTVTETLVIYNAADSLLADGKTMVLVPVVGRLVFIDSTLPLEKKISILADTLSVVHFNGLKIDLLRITNTDDYRVMVVNLQENNDFRGPGTVAPYHSWYDFFQGSYGGQSTTIILTNTLLQKTYPGEWPSVLEIYYNGTPIEEWDHINLNGRLER